MSAGYHALRRAEAKARARQLGGGARELIRALALDPARTSAKLAYRGIRAVRQVFSTPRHQPPVSYFEMSTTQAAPAPPGDIKSIASALARWDKRRMGRFSDR